MTHAGGTVEPSLAEAHARALDAWVAPTHTSHAAMVANRARFEHGQRQLALLPDFLTADAASRISAFLETDAAFTERFAVVDDGPRESVGAEGDVHERERLVSAEEWEATPAPRRFLRFSVGPGTPTRPTVGWMRYHALQAMLHGPAFHAFAEAVSGLPLGPVSSLTAHAMRTGDLLAPHSDANHRRRLAFILYLSPGWRPEFGGALLVTHRDGDDSRIDPAFNQLVLFDVLGHRSHRVEAITGLASDRRRLTIGGWFDHPASPTGVAGAEDKADIHAALPP